MLCKDGRRWVRQRINRGGSATVTPGPDLDTVNSDAMLDEQLPEESKELGRMVMVPGQPLVKLRKSEPTGSTRGRRKTWAGTAEAGEAQRRVNGHTIHMTRDNLFMVTCLLKNRQVRALQNRTSRVETAKNSAELRQRHFVADRWRVFRNAMRSGAGIGATNARRHLVNVCAASVAE